MGLGITLTDTVVMDVYENNITHNLSTMAIEAGIYTHLWRPEELSITRAGQLIEPLTAGVALLKSDPERFKAFDAPNKWGTYDQFVEFVACYLAACIKYPNASVAADR